MVAFMRFIRNPRTIPKYTLCSLLVSCGGTLFGLDTGTIGPITTMPSFLTTFSPSHTGHLSSTLHGLIVSSILIPAAIASFFTGHLADWLGRVRSVALGGLVFGIGAGMEAASGGWATGSGGDGAGGGGLAMLFVGRIVKGVGEGLYLSTLVVYITEISPPHHRGTLASLPQLLITFGICAGYFLCYGTVRLSSSASWRLPFALQAVLALSFAISCLLLLPESPRWLVLKGKRLGGEEVTRVWEGLGVSGVEREKAVEEGVVEVAAGAGVEGSVAGSTAGSKIKGKQNEIFKIFGKKVWKRTLLGVFLMSMQQLSGIDGVLYYAPLLFSAAGLSSSTSSFLASGISGLLIFLVTIPAFLLCDRWGRRTSTIFGALGITACMFVIGALYASDSVHGDRGAGRWVVVVLIYVFCVVFSVSWAVGIKVYASEIQSPETRAAGSSVAYGANWITNFLIAFTTPIFLAHSSSGVYFLFGTATLLTALVCAFFMPETRGKSLEDIDGAFERSASALSAATGLRVRMGVSGAGRLVRRFGGGGRRAGMGTVGAVGEADGGGRGGREEFDVELLGMGTRVA
ncbi:general substrate transporter [Aulographum hederae CBS 113979]|uniref:General substrate transporter n=1 Tax=Aulographum hederae CBS 113979 TaxID=1176131 RepID=A0A6G1GNX4_9PEZI|nr:general substrate transporter [Aulographum hederae CBS 113979]